jgi:hypothetical protein
MRRIACLLLAASSLGAQRPRYGGTLVIETRHPTFAPLPSLTGDTLVRLGEGQRLEPGLATSWSRDAARRRWRFELRPDVRLHDGSLLTPAAVAEALAIHKATASDNAIVIESASDTLPAELARLPAAIPGSGRFRRTEPGTPDKIVLTAHDRHWGGRPFLDSADIYLSRPWKEQLNDYESGKADIVEVSPVDFRRQAQRGRRGWASQPVDLLALVFARNRPTVQEERVRLGVALAVDRPPMLNVILQKLGEVTGGFVPQWMSGYGFLFPADRDAVRARRLLQPPPVLVLNVDAADPALRAVADRIALDVREAGGLVRVQPGTGGDFSLVRARGSVWSAADALEAYGLALQLPVARPVGLEAAYEAERKLLEGTWVVPLVHVSETYAISDQLKNWRGAVAAGWGLEDVWLEPAP